MIGPKNNKHLIGGDRDKSIMRSNDQILRAAQKGMYLPGKNSETYMEQVISNNKMLLDSTVERQKEQAESKGETKGGFLDSVLKTVESSLGFGTNNRLATAFEKKSGPAVYQTASSIGNTITSTVDSVLSAPKYLMIFAGIILLILIIRK